MPWEIVIKSVIAGLAASLACGLGVLPLMLGGLDPQRHRGLGYGFASGLMFSASVYNLILPGLQLGSPQVDLKSALSVTAGVLCGALLIWSTNRWLSNEQFEQGYWKKWGGRAGLLIFLAMAIHSIPEGVAIGVGYASEEVLSGHLGSYISLAIAIHNIPEGLAVAIPLRAAGASLPRCFFAAFLTSLPQPIAAVPATILSWLFHPIMTLLMGFAAGAMIFLVLLEMLPDALARMRPSSIAWSFILGFCLMLLVQVLL
jgi:zinc transporter ZupT